MIDYSKYPRASAEPEPSCTMESYRAIGYSIETALADIIDNSISAGAKNVWVNFQWKGPDTWIYIKDDGCGMDDDALLLAMRPGSKNPNEERNVTDLGRFGLGLKTASFSQCRRLSVVSKKSKEKISFWTWDFDFVNKSRKWDVIKYLPDEFENILDDTDSGTAVIWNDLDRLVKSLGTDEKSALDKFLFTMKQVKTHLAMVFHRYIENNQINIIFQQRSIEHWDPFLKHHGATQKFPAEPLQNNRVQVRGFVLPHKSKLDEEEFKLAEGPKGWNEHQGFYIYRNQRLLMAGSWLGLFKKQEHFNLARIMIDLPNSLDAEWQIDIKKETARPPAMIKEQLKAYATKVRNQATEVFRHKGKVLQRKYAQVEFCPMWLEKLRHGKRFYEINRNHPLINTMEADLNGKSKEFNQLLRFLEETVPVSLITIKESEQPELQGQPFEETDHDIVKKTMKQMYVKLVGDGKSDQMAKSIILNIEPFNLYPEYIESLK